jgi:hypothetical protein
MRKKTVPNGRKIFQILMEYAKHFPFQGPPKFISIGIFGVKINHLATLHSGTGTVRKECCHLVALLAKFSLPEKNKGELSL